MASRKRRSSTRRRRAANPVRRRRATVKHHRRASAFRVKRHARRRSNPSRSLRASTHHRRRSSRRGRRRNPSFSVGKFGHFAKSLAVAAGGAFLVDLASGFVPAGWKVGLLGSAVQAGLAYLLYEYAPVSAENKLLLGIGGGVRAAITALAPVFNVASGFLRPSGGTNGIASYTPGQQLFPAYGSMGAIAQFVPGQNPFPAYSGNLAGIVR